MHAPGFHHSSLLCGDALLAPDHTNLANQNLIRFVQATIFRLQTGDPQLQGNDEHLLPLSERALGRAVLFPSSLRAEVRWVAWVVMGGSGEN